MGDYLAVKKQQAAPVQQDSGTSAVTEFWANATQFEKMAIGGIVVCLIGLFLPWVTVNAGAWGTVNASGMNDSGAVLGVIIGAAGIVLLATKNKDGAWAVAAGGVLGLLMGIKNYLDINNISGFGVSAGFGLYIYIVGAAVLCYGAYMILKDKKLI
ncbi:Uncharacterised protein [Candidatus Gugararchaeum adminiculabundum]|nr:Uncharacterised protein [Candidatus Gugararchaeum adminiculabundum]